MSLDTRSLCLYLLLAGLQLCYMPTQLYFFFLKTWSYFIVQIGPELLGNPPASISKMPMLSSLQLITKLSSGPDPKLTCATSPCPSAVICCPRLVSEGKPLPCTKPSPLALFWLFSLPSEVSHSQEGQATVRTKPPEAAGQ